MIISCVEPLGISQQRFEELKNEFESRGHQLRYYMDRVEDDERLLPRMADADVVVVSNIAMTAERLQQCHNLKYISVAFAGIDHVDTDYCRQHSITVRNAADYAKHAVAELTVGLMIDLLRRITPFDAETRHGGCRGGFVGRQLLGKTVGVVGTGYIGQQVCRLLLAFGCSVVAYSRSRRPEVEAMGVKYMTLDELLKCSDIVTLHLPLTAQTKHLIGVQQLELMKPTALLVNTARGNVADIAAVAEALQAGRLAGAAFDVYEKEPPLPHDHPLLACADKCLLVPHVGYATHEAFAYREQVVFDNVREYLFG